MDKAVELFYVTFNINSIVPFEERQLVHSGFIWKIMWISLNVGEVSRPVEVTHDVLIYRMVDEKKMEIDESFLSEKI